MLKKLLISCSLMLLLINFFSFNSVKAQDIFLIPQLGFNLNTYDFNESASNFSNQRLTGGLTAGLGLNIALNTRRTFILQPEINYVMKNTIIDHHLLHDVNVETDRSNSGVRERYMMHYIEIPLLARFDFGINTRYYLNIGPSFSFAVAGNQKIDSYEDNIPSSRTSADFNTSFYRTDFGAQVGGGIEIPFNETFLVVDGRYSMGFRNLKRAGTFPDYSNENNDPIYIPAEGRNRIFTLSIGYALPLN